MDRISGLPDDLLVKTLSFVPTKVAVSTCLLSKRWQFLWLWLPKLDYNFRHSSPSSLGDFIDKTLPLHRAPVIESLRLELSSTTELQDFRKWVDIAVSRYVRELDISYLFKFENIFPSGFYTCKSLVILKLRYVTLVDVPYVVSLPSLKTLQLVCLTYQDDESLHRLLSICPLLEDLSVEFRADNRREEFSVILPSLHKLSLFIPGSWRFNGYEIDTPSLKYFKLRDWNCYRHKCLIKNMPKLREAYVDVRYDNLKSVIHSITSVKRLTVCSEDDYGDGIVFNKLEHLTMCVCQKGSWTLLCELLKDSPNLRVLDISVVKDHTSYQRNVMVYWNQPSHVPECFLSSLQIVNWSRYFGRPHDREFAAYILKNARQLKTVIVKVDPLGHNLKMIKELTLSSRASSTCELVFVEGGDIYRNRRL